MSALEPAVHDEDGVGRAGAGEQLVQGAVRQDGPAAQEDQPVAAGGLVHDVA